MPLEFADLNYFQECINDQSTLFVPVTIKRCIGMTPVDIYPDSPPALTYASISMYADIREAAYDEVFQSGGLLIKGDLLMWTREYIKGAGNGAQNDPVAIADTIVLFKEEFTIVGFPMRGRGRDSMIWGYQTYLRKRVGLNTQNEQRV